MFFFFIPRMQRPSFCLHSYSQYDLAKWTVAQVARSVGPRYQEYKKIPLNYLIHHFGRSVFVIFENGYKIGGNSQQKSPDMEEQQCVCLLEDPARKGHCALIYLDISSFS